MKTVKGFSKIVAMVGAVALGLTLSACGNTNSASNTDSKNSGSTPTVRSCSTGRRTRTTSVCTWLRSSAITRMPAST